MAWIYLMNGRIIFNKWQNWNIKIDLLNICNKSNYFIPELYINYNNINDFDNCDYLNITELTICTHNNINLLLDKLYKFTNIRFME